ncbi:MAG: ion channel [Gallionella sp.]|nr:ion channel [Gallionella sp.]
MKAVQLLGIAGVADSERSAAKRWAGHLEWPMVAVVCWIVIQWYLEETGLISPVAARVADWLVWLAFVLETAILATLVRNKPVYLMGNWMNLLVILGGIPFFWQFAPLTGLLRSFRLGLVLLMLIRMSKSARRLLSQHRLGTTLIVALVTMVLSGLMISRLDPSIGSVWDGMWWAWVTMATVGYGDVVPHNGPGRLFGSLLILFGVVLLSLLTANLAAFFIGSDVENVEREERQADRLLQQISDRLDRIERQLENLDAAGKPDKSA